MGKERKAATRAAENSHRICPFFAMEQRADESRSFMNAHGFFHKVHKDKVGRIVKEWARKKEDAKARMIGKHLNEEGRGGTRENKRRDGRESGLRQRAEPTREGRGRRSASETEADGRARR